MLYIAYFILASGHNIKRFLCKFSIFDLQRVENYSSSLCTHQMPLNHLQTVILKLLGGSWLGLDGPSGHYVGPRALKYPYCHQMIIQTHPRGNRRNSEKSKCEKNSIANPPRRESTPSNAHPK